MPPYPLTNFKKQKYYQNKPKFNAAYSRNNLPKIKDGAYVINLDEFKSIETHWIALYVNGNNASIRFDNVWILLYWIYWLYVKRHTFVRLYKTIFS